MSARTLLFATALTFSLAAFAGCGPSGETTTGGGGNTGTGGSGGSDTPPPPTLGEQVDRMGRPAINTAANHTFDLNPEAKDAAKDAWNANDDPSKWSAYVAEIQTNIAILDGLDTVCGNQLLADMTKMDATRYAGLAGVLADDRLYVNTEGMGCNQYLAVEAKAVGIDNMDCGGRKLIYDVIETSYSVLAAGMLTGVDDDVPASDAATGEIFPHVLPPH